MSWDTTPSQLESVFVQRNTLNTFYNQINITGSDLIIYHDEYGILNADKISVWATKYNVGGIVTNGSYNISTSYASASISSSFSITSSYAIGGYLTNSLNALTSDFALLAGNSINSTSASYSLTSSIINTKITGSPTIDPGWITSNTIAMNHPDKYIRIYIDNQAYMIPAWITN